MIPSNIIIIPTYNEELNIGILLEILKSDFSDFFILVIDDSPNELTKKTFDNHKYSWKERDHHILLLSYWRYCVLI